MSKGLDEAIEKLVSNLCNMVGRSAYGGGGPSNGDRNAMANALREIVREAINDARTKEL